MRINIFILFFSPFLFFGQQINIAPLSANINTINAEFNFVQVNKDKAYFSSSELEGEKYRTAIFSAFLKNGFWQKDARFNLGDEFSNANINFKEYDSIIYYSNCNNLDECKIAAYDINTAKTKNLSNHINQYLSTNTQPHLSSHGALNVMYFVSNRKGGFGGLDIWLSIIDTNGNFGMPINLGPKINSKFDEITPFYNSYDGELYFSSNRNNSYGGFDIYKSDGKLNIWKKSINVVQLNSKKDEMYLNFYKKNTGFFSSNRSGAKYVEDDFCCSDIFTFDFNNNDYSSDTIDSTDILDHFHYTTNFTPLELYFDNDEPDCCTMDTTTEKTYREAYLSYLKMQEIYCAYDSELTSFFQDKLKDNYSKLNLILTYILTDLTEGKKIHLQIKGYSSPLHSTKYNVNLSKRRIKSFVNFVSLFRDKVFADYIDNQSFQIIELPFGEKSSTNSVSDNPNNKQESIFSIGAMLERKIEIIDIKLVE